jgi:NADH-quinone oxidoreductase subunit E
LDEKLQKALTKYVPGQASLIPLLQAVQEELGYVSEESILAISKHLGIPASEVFGVLTFYSQFHLQPRGRHIIQQCVGTACHVRGAKKIVDAVQDELGIRAGETTPDLKATYEVVYCLGSCALAPAAIIDGNVVARLTSDQMLKLISDLP